MREALRWRASSLRPRPGVVCDTRGPLLLRAGEQVPATDAQVSSLETLDAPACYPSQFGEAGWLPVEQAPRLNASAGAAGVGSARAPADPVLHRARRRASGLGQPWQW